jgi:hypothetical protein
MHIPKALAKVILVHPRVVNILPKRRWNKKRKKLSYLDFFLFSAKDNLSSPDPSSKKDNQRNSKKETKKDS